MRTARAHESFTVGMIAQGPQMRRLRNSGASFLIPGAVRTGSLSALVDFAPFALGTITADVHPLPKPKARVPPCRDQNFA
jgi:hypothetical protein